MSAPDFDADELLDRAAADYFARRARGETVDREKFLAEYPQIARELTETFMGEAMLDGVFAFPTTQPTVEPISLGDLDLGEEIGRGGMGVVQRARQRSLGREVAVKRIRVSTVATEAEVARFRQEAQSVAKLAHPNILPIYTVLEAGDDLLMVMPLATGGDLRTMLQHGPLAPELAAKLMTDVARAIAYAHERGVIHRDLKPANIMLDEAGRPLVADFGLAKLAEADGNLTQTGQIVGTPSYMAPEQAEASATAVGPAIDVYALGATLYALLVGQPPFQADSPLATLTLVREHRPAAPRSINPHIPRALEAIVLKCLQKSPADRYASAHELAADLERFRAGEPVAAAAAKFWSGVLQNLGRTSNRQSMDQWRQPLMRIGVLVFAVHLALELAAALGASWLAPRLVLRLGLFVVLVRWLAIWRRGDVWPINAFERTVWSIWIGYLAALPVADLGAAAAGLPRGAVVAVECLLAGAAFIATGGPSWGGSYIFGALFFALSAFGWFFTVGLDMAFGALWFAAMVGIGVNAKR